MYSLKHTSRRSQHVLFGELRKANKSLVFRAYLQLNLTTKAKALASPSQLCEGRVWFSLCFAVKKLCTVEMVQSCWCSVLELRLIKSQYVNEPGEGESFCE